MGAAGGTPAPQEQAALCAVGSSRMALRLSGLRHCDSASRRAEWRNYLPRLRV